MNNIKKKTNIRNVVATTSFAAMLLSSGLAPAAIASAPNIPEMQSNQMVSLPTVNESEVVPDEYIVSFKEGTSKQDILEDITKYDAEVLSENWDTLMFTLKLKDAQYEHMKEDVKVDIIEENITFSATANYGTLEQYSHTKTNVQQAWTKNYKGKGIKIAILDSGISSHSDLKIAGGVSKVSYTKSYADDNGHGTHVAGIIASLDNGEGTTGVASEASIYSVKVIQQNGKTNLSDIIAGLDWAIQQNVDIINMSLGTATNSAALKKRIDEAEAKGIIVVAAAGNTGNTNIAYPAMYDNVVAVGATDENNELASFSSYGDAIKLVAPGNRVSSTYLKDSYSFGSGTSQAAPYVAGMIALYEEAYPDKSAKEIVDMVYANALDLGTPGRDALYGYGLVQFPEGSIIEQAEETISNNNINPQIDDFNDYLTWDSFSDTGLYHIEMQQKDENGNFQSYRFNRTVNNSTFDLRLLERGYEYRLVLTPQINGEYKDNATVKLYVSTINDVTKVDTSEINETKQVSTMTKDLNSPLPTGFTYNEETNTLKWEEVYNSSYFRIQMEQKQSDGTFKQFNYNRTSSNLTFALTPLKDGYEYKMTFIPRDSRYQFLEEHAISFYVNYKNGKKTFSQVPFSEKEDTITPEVGEKAPTNVEQATIVNETPSTSLDVPNGVLYNESKHLVSWDAIDGAKRYLIQAKVKNASGVYETYKLNTTVTSAKFSLDVLPKNKEFQITITPYIGYAYVTDKAYKIYVDTKTFTVGSFN